MTGVHDLALFVAAGLLLNVTPGPDMAYIAARSAAGGVRDGVAATLGITAGCVVHTLAAAFGLAALLATSSAAFALVKWCGAAYLLYIGARLLAGAAKSGSEPAIVAARPRAPVREKVDPVPESARTFREALIINVFNPKVALFFLAFLPQFISADAPAKALSFVLLGCLFSFNSLFVNLPVAWLASRASRGLRASARLSRWLAGAAGALFVALAARLATLERA
jgi:threonine/homoserine/homoserine lactone efflux protein